MSFNLTYYSNNGTGKTLSGPFTTPCRLQSNIFETGGYILHSWNTKADGTGITYAKNQYIGTDIEGQSIGGELYAIWKLSGEGQVRIQNGNTIVDISDIVKGVHKVFGKNQPFNYTTFEVIKNLFNSVGDGGYWKTRQALHPTDPEFVKRNTKPELIQRETKILVDVYGIKGEWLFEKVDEKNDTSWKVTAVSQSYHMKTTTLENLLTFEPTISSTGELTHVKFTKIDNTKRAVTSLGYGRYSIQLNVEYRNRVNVYVSSEKITIYFDATQTPSVERVTGTGTAIFAFIAKYCCGFTGSNTSTKRIFIDDGFIYDFTNGTYSEVQSSYTQLEIEQIKGRAKLPLSGTVMGRTYDAKNVELRVDEYCSTIVGGLCALSNRYAFFDEDAYFVDYQVTVGGVRSEILQSEFTDPKTYDSANKIRINWGGDNTVKDGYFVPELMGLSTNADQGSQYILQSQKVISESYERTVVISDSLSTISGSDIKYMYREHASNDGANNFTFDTATRNFQTSIIALNQIVNWYKPGDCIAYNMCETKQQYTYTVESYAELIATYPAGGNDKSYTALVLGSTDFKGRVYKGSWDGSAWVWGAEGDYTDENYATLERDARYKIYSVASEVKDIQNDFTLYDVPLSGITITYPSCVTSYFWGNPYFMDEESEFSDMSAITSDSTLDNTSDTQISDNYAAKIVVGNQSLAELADDRKGYTGLILEKNWDAELYRLAGYDNGKLQAQFNTQGKITAGGGSVVLDDTGMKTYDLSTTPTVNNWVTHIDTSGAFKTGNSGDGFGNVQLKGDGLSIFYNTGKRTSEAIKFIHRDPSTGSLYTTSKIYNLYNGISTENIFESFSDKNGKSTPLMFKCNGSSSATIYKSIKESQRDPSEGLNIVNFTHTKSSSYITEGNWDKFTIYPNDGETTPYGIRITPGSIVDVSSTVKTIFRAYLDEYITSVSDPTVECMVFCDGGLISDQWIRKGNTIEVDISNYSKLDKIIFNAWAGASSAGKTVAWAQIKTLIPSTDAIIRLDSSKTYPAQLPSNVSCGTDSANAHEFHGHVTFHDGYTVNGGLNLDDATLTALANALRPKLGL